LWHRFLSRRKSVRRVNLPASGNPFHRLIRRPWRLSTPSPSRPHSRHRQQLEPDDTGVEDSNHCANASSEEPGEEQEPGEAQEPGGPDRNLPSFTPGDETDENVMNKEMI
jgi:hypothetical protein